MAFRPLNSTNALSQNFGQVNDMIRQLNNEQVTKTFKQSGGNSIVQGKLPYTNGYGTLYYDTNNVPRIIIGIAPDGNIDIGVSKEGYDITTLYT